MATIQVSCHRWLGLSARYAVRIDGREVGRLGRRSKQITAEVEAGGHSILVDCNGQRTPALTVEVDEGEEVRVELAFSWLDIYRKGRSRRLSYPVGAAGEVDYMALVRSDGGRTP